LECSKYHDLRLRVCNAFDTNVVDIKCVFKLLDGLTINVLDTLVMWAVTSQLKPPQNVVKRSLDMLKKKNKTTD